MIRGTDLIVPLALGSVVLYVGWRVARGAAGAATDAMESASDVLGIPGPSQVSDDPRVARWIADYPETGGWWEASFWATPAALIAAGQLDEGTGEPPPPGTAARRQFPPAHEMAIDIPSGDW